MTATYSKWTIILLNRNRLFVILNHVNSQTKSLLQLTLDLLSFSHIEISQYSLFPNREPSPIKNHLCKHSHIFLPLDEAKPNLLYC